jgi:ABC-2 type transport system permease protein
MRVLSQLVAKECLLLLRDGHALLLLFAMPALFILVMSVALRDRFVAGHGGALTYYLVNADGAGPAADIEARLKADPAFEALPSPAPKAELATLVARDRADFLVGIPAGFRQALCEPEPRKIQVLCAPGVPITVYRLFEAAVLEAATRAYLKASVACLKGQTKDFPGVEKLEAGVDLDLGARLLDHSLLRRPGPQPERPSSVQQNVPAWLVFAMFFIAIPLSTTWVQEESQGTFGRLRSMGVGSGLLLLGKLLPYLGINLLQVLLMLAVGVWGVPLFGGERLSLGHQPAALGLIALSVSLASVSYALFIANVARTSEQATILTGGTNLLLAALGGIMVPRFVMPEAMQAISFYSPMAWGLEGFLDVLLRQGGLASVLDEAWRLLTFALVGFGLAALVLAKKRGR